MGKEVVYKTQLTGKALLLSATPVAMACLLFFYAYDANNKFGPNDPSRYFFILAPLLVGIAVLVTLVYLSRHYLGRTLKITDNELLYQDSQVYLQLDLCSMAFSPPSKSAPLKTIMFSDGKTFVQIPELFIGTKPFNELNQTIKEARRRNQNSAYDQKTYSF